MTRRRCTHPWVLSHTASPGWTTSGYAVHETCSACGARTTPMPEVYRDYLRRVLGITTERTTP